MTLVIMDLIATLSLNDTQHNGTRHKNWMLLCLVSHFECHYAECHYDKCRYSECRGANNIPAKFVQNPPQFRDYVFSYVLISLQFLNEDLRINFPRKTIFEKFSPPIFYFFHTFTFLVHIYNHYFLFSIFFLLSFSSSTFTAICAKPPFS